MTKKELIEKLKGLPDDMEVYIEDDYDRQFPVKKAEAESKEEGYFKPHPKQGEGWNPSHIFIKTGEKKIIVIK